MYRNRGGRGGRDVNSKPPREVVRPGTLLWWVHEAGRSPAQPGPNRVVCSADQACALLETLVPDPRFTSEGRRVLDRSALVGKRLSAVRTTRELLVVRATSAEDVAVEEARADGVIKSSAQAWPVDVLSLPGPALAEVAGRSLALDGEDGAGILTDLVAPFRIRLRGPARPGMPLVFLNYRTAGGTEEVLLLDDELRRRFGDDAVFRDHRSLHAGVDFAEELLKNARSAKVLLAVIGKRWEKSFDARGRRLLDDSSDWVRREIAEAFRCGVRVVPILVGVRESLTHQTLPQDIRRLADLQFLHLRHRATAADVALLVDDLIGEVPELTAPRTAFL